MEKFDFFFSTIFKLANLNFKTLFKFSSIKSSKQVQQNHIEDPLHHTNQLVSADKPRFSPQRCETIELFTIGSSWSAAKLKIFIAFFPTHSPVPWIRSFWTRVTRIHIRKIRLTSVQPTARNLFIVSRQQANTSAFYWAGMRLGSVYTTTVRLTQTFFDLAKCSVQDGFSNWGKLCSNRRFWGEKSIRENVIE